MPFAKVVYHWERVVPVRFSRAPTEDPTVSTGPIEASAPDPDDRGFLPHATGGPIFPMGLDENVDFDKRDKVRVRLLRENIDDGAALFLKTNPGGIVSIDDPPPGSPLPSTTAMLIKMRPQARGKTDLEVHFGSDSGPIIHKMNIQVNRMIRIRFSLHVPTINGNVQNDSHNNVVPPVSTRSDASIRKFIQDMNKIYFPYGIQAAPDAAIDHALVLNLLNQGMVDDSVEWDNVLLQNRVAHSVNAHFVPQIAGPNNPDPNSNIGPDIVGGVGVSLVGGPTDFGLLIADWVAFQSVGHELGHVLNLVNDPTNQFVHVNTVTDPTSPGTGKVVRDDIVSRRRLMYAFTNIVPSQKNPHRNDVGYGAGNPGAMLTIKQLNNDKTDLEMAEVRKSAARL
jgi:hypothetical protein